MKPSLEQIGTQTQSASFHCQQVELWQKRSYWHYHPEIELTYVLNGSGVRMVGDHVGNFGPGDLMLTGENLPHDFNMLSPDERAYFLVIQFPTALVQSLPEFAKVADMLNTAKQGILFAQQPDAIAKCLSSFIHLSPPKQLLALLDVLYQLARQGDYTSLCSASFAGHPMGTIQLSRLNRTIDFVNQHYDRAVALSELAQLTNMTESSFSRWFKHAMDCNFVQYLNKCRTEQACRLLLQSPQQIARIAEECGFETLSSFNRAFKKFKGMSPMQFRKQWHKTS